jgi:hypothetical protein
MNRSLYNLDDEEVDKLEDIESSEILEKYESWKAKQIAFNNNIKLFESILKWDGGNPNIHNDYFRFRRALHASITEAVYNMEIRGVENGDDTYRVYAGTSEFKWYNNEYTVYAKRRDPKKDEKEINMSDQISDITSAIYNKKRSPDTVLKEGETEWEGTLVGKEAAVDVAIKWDRNLWQSTAHLPTQGKFRGRLVTHAELYAAVYGFMMTAINTGRDLKGSTKAALEDHFTERNTLGFWDRLQNKIVDDMSQ